MTTVPVQKVFEIIIANKDNFGRDDFIVIVKKLKELGIKVDNSGEKSQSVLIEGIKTLAKFELSDVIEWYSDTYKGEYFGGLIYDLILNQKIADLDQLKVMLVKICEMKNTKASAPLKSKCESFIKELEDKQKVDEHPKLVEQVKELKDQLHEEKLKTEIQKRNLEDLVGDNCILKAKLDKMTQQIGCTACNDSELEIVKKQLKGVKQDFLDLQEDYVHVSDQLEKEKQETQRHKKNWVNMCDDYNLLKAKFDKLTQQSDSTTDKQLKELQLELKYVTQLKDSYQAELEKLKATLTGLQKVINPQ